MKTMKLLQSGCLLLLAAVTMLTSGCSYDTAKFANGKHRSLTLLLPGSPSIDSHAKLVHNNPTVVYMQNGAPVNSASQQPSPCLVPPGTPDGQPVQANAPANGAASGLPNGYVVVQPPDDRLPLAPVFGINSDGYVGYSGSYESQQPYYYQNRNNCGVTYGGASSTPYCPGLPVGTPVNGGAIWNPHWQ